MKKIMLNDAFGLTQAVLEGRKTQTRRIIKVGKEELSRFQEFYYNQTFYLLKGEELVKAYFYENPERLPYKADDIVAIAQAYNDFYDEGYNPTLFPPGAGWDNKMFVRADLMPHQIRITNVRIERLQDISDEDCIKEGVELNTRQYEYDGTKYYCVRGLGYWRGFGCTNFHTPREAFAALIDKVSGKGTWERNPYVFVYDFELVK